MIEWSLAPVSDRLLQRDIFDQISKLAQLDGEQLTQYAQCVFERTTLYFVSNGFDQERHRQKLYLHMVAAHWNLSFAAWKATSSYLEDITSLEGLTDHPWKLPDKENLPKSNEARERKSDTQTANFYLTYLSRREHTWERNRPPIEIEMEMFVRKYLAEAEKESNALTDCFYDFRGVNFALTKTDYRDAWLVMMLRGIAWFKSQNTSGRLTPVRSGGAIPSSLWDNQRSVWII